jgi:hypothetical protein
VSLSSAEQIRKLAAREEERRSVQRLLILSCSQRKRLDPGLLPAFERYDGPTFRVLRRYLRQVLTNAPSACILSAEFGLISAFHPIPHYDRRMTRERALELRPAVQGALTEMLGTGEYREVLLCAGKMYRLAIDGCESLLTSGITLWLAEGGPGNTSAALHQWLRNAPQECVAVGSSSPHQ